MSGIRGKDSYQRVRRWYARPRQFRNSLVRITECTPGAKGRRRVLKVTLADVQALAVAAGNTREVAEIRAEGSLGRALDINEVELFGFSWAPRGVGLFIC